MSFKNNLKKKLRIQALAKTIAISTGAPGIPKKIDKQKTRELLAMSPYVREKRRDLELYFRKLDESSGEVLVLDNELPLYGNTTLDDIALRRSPELKEMVSIRNIIKILNDRDVLISKGRDALFYVRDRSLELLDLRYDSRDIRDMADEGGSAFARADSDGVLEMLELFVDILGYTPLPAGSLVNDYVMYGATEPATGAHHISGPVVMYDEKTNTLRLLDRRIKANDPAAREYILAVATGSMEPDQEGLNIFPFLAEAVLTQKKPTVH